jgi:hypothetical protein
MVVLRSKKSYNLSTETKEEDSSHEMDDYNEDEEQDNSDYEMSNYNEDEKSPVEDEGDSEDNKEDGDEGEDEDEYEDEDEDEDEDDDEYEDEDEDEDADENFVIDDDKDDDKDDDEDTDEDDDADNEQDNCHGQQECKRVFKDRAALLRHIRVCEACPFKWERIRDDPDEQPTPTHACEHCDQAYMLKSTLTMHMTKHHGHPHLCMHKDCATSIEKFSDWGLNLHAIMEHSGIGAKCPVPSCQTPYHNRASMLGHLSAVHGIVANSVPSLVRLDLKEVYGYQKMTDPDVTYINVIHHLVDVKYPDISELPQGISAGVSCKGPRRVPGTSSPSDMYYKV